VRSREKIGMGWELADESVCPTVTQKGLRSSGPGAFAGESIFSRLLTVAARKVDPYFEYVTEPRPCAPVKKCEQPAAYACGSERTSQVRRELQSRDREGAGAFRIF
jgi:hypothetical protein